jgi:hypothetical protein
MRLRLAFVKSGDSPSDLLILPGSGNSLNCGDRCIEKTVRFTWSPTIKDHASRLTERPDCSHLHQKTANSGSDSYLSSPSWRRNFDVHELKISAALPFFTQ